MRSLRRLRRWGVGLMILLIAAAVLFAYLLPRSSGDRFAGALIRLNLEEAQGDLCPKADFGQVVSLFGGENTLGAWLAQQLQHGVQIPGWADLVSHLRLSSAYDPLTGAYTFSYAMEQTLEVAGFRFEAGVTTPSIALRLRRLGPISFCLAVY